MVSVTLSVTLDSADDSVGKTVLAVIMITRPFVIISMSNSMLRLQLPELQFIDTFLDLDLILAVKCPQVKLNIKVGIFHHGSFSTSRYFSH